MRRHSGSGWFELIIGILLVLFGIYTFICPWNALTWIVILYGLFAVLIGISDIVRYVKMEKYTGFAPVVSLISGIFSVLAGVMLLVYPGSGKWIAALLLPIWFIAHCISRLAQLNVIKATVGKFHYYFTLIISILGIILGFMMIMRPVISLFSTGFIIGMYLVLLGIDCIVLAVNKIGSK